MGKKLSVCVICLVMCFIVPVRYASGVETVSVPVWQVGDEWTSTSPNMTTRMVVTGTETVTVGGVNYDCYVLSMNLSGAHGSMNATGYFQRSTLVYVKAVSTSTYGPITSTFSPPLDMFGFPLFIGKTWSVTTTITSQGSGSPSSHQITYNFTCLAKETITVPAGTFEAYKIKQQQSPDPYYTLNYYAPKVGFIAKSESYNYYNGSWHSSGDPSVLSSYEYTYNEKKPSEGLFGLGTQTFWLIVVLIIVAVAIIIAFGLVFRHRKRYPVYPPSYHPQMAAQQIPYQPQLPQQPTPPAGSPLYLQFCPYCKQGLRFIQQYRRWYCDRCQKYV